MTTCPFIAKMGTKKQFFRKNVFYAYAQCGDVLGNDKYSFQIHIFAKLRAGGAQTRAPPFYL